MSHIEFYDTYVHNVAIIFYIFDFIKVFRQTDVGGKLRKLQTILFLDKRLVML